MDGTDASRIRGFLDGLFQDRTLIPKTELQQAAEEAGLSDEILGYVDRLPPGNYGREELGQRLIGPVTEGILTDHVGAD